MKSLSLPDKTLFKKKKKNTNCHKVLNEKNVVAQLNCRDIFYLLFLIYFVKKGRF